MVGRLGRTFLRLATPLADLRRVPVIGPCLRWASGKLVPRDSRIWVQVQHGAAKGVWLNLNPRTGRDYYAGEVELEVQYVLQKYLRDGMTFYDIGANIGFFSLLGARLVGPKGHVVSFEADPEIATRLRDHVSRNQDPVIQVEETAVWSSSHPVEFARSDTNRSPDRGLGHVVATGAEVAPCDTIRINAVTLDEYAAKSCAPDFIKCDVEGAEVEVFRGARKLLLEKRPGILCELHGEDNRRVLLEEFAELGYHCEPVGKNHVLALRPNNRRRRFSEA